MEIVLVLVISRKLVLSVNFAEKATNNFALKQKVIAVDCYGGLAEHIVVDGRFVFKLPPELDSAKSAPLMSSGLTVYSGIVRAKLPNNSMVGVLGVGGLGYFGAPVSSQNGAQGFSIFSLTNEKRDD